MNISIFKRAAVALGLTGALAMHFPAQAGECPEYLDHEFAKLNSSQTVNICEEYAGRPILIVNTASHCGFTPQFEGLQVLHEKYGDRGLAVIGFPSNDFKQESGSEAETAKVCYINYGVTFTMAAPISVKGNDAHPLFQELARRSEVPRWNFNKYLLSPSGDSVKHFGSGTAPDADIMIRSIESLL